MPNLNRPLSRGSPGPNLSGPCGPPTENRRDRSWNGFSTKAPAWRQPSLQTIATAPPRARTLTPRPARSADNARLRTLYELTPDAILFIDGEGRIVDCNQSAVAALRAPRAHLIGLRAGELASAADPGWPVALSTLRERGRFRGQLEVRRMDGTDYPTDAVIAEIPDAAGSAGSAMVLRDATARVQAEGRIREALDAEHDALRKLEAISAAKSRFLSMLSHDVRTAVLGIEWMAVPLRGPDTAAAERAKLADQVSEEARRVQRLLSDVLELDLLESGRLTLRRAAVNLVEVLTPMLTALEARGRPVSVGVMGSPPVVDGDRDRLAQVFSNLLSNAWKFSPRGSPIGVTVGVAGGSAVVTVHNEGDPIPPRLHAAVFERFTQAARAENDGTSGCGLGLAIVRDLVRLHNGEVSLMSTRRAGTTFRVMLPLAAG